MANITGTNKIDHLFGTAGDDQIDGRGGHDQIEGGQGDDTLTGGNGRDTFVLRVGDGTDIVTDYLHGEDRTMLDSRTGVYDGILPPLGFLFDGQDIYNSQGTLVVSVHAVDWNGDSVTDTQLLMPTGDALVLLGVAPGDLTSADIFGG